MIKTFTPDIEIPAQTTQHSDPQPLTAWKEPSQNAIRNILNYSKNLEAIKSSTMDPILIVKS